MNIVANLHTFLGWNLGAKGVGDTPENRGQCVGLVEQWLTLNAKPHIWGDAKDLLNNADRHIYTVIMNNPQNYPQPGDVVCWDSSWGAGHGHTAVVIDANVNYLAVFEQNDPDGAPCIVATHNYTGVIGWLRWAS